jgi:peptidoglycan/xylan/chitin deacetylase (PgdA/CDA1 family)
LSPTSNVYGKTYARVASTQKAIALTFDDGPNEPYTSQILDILSSYGVKATFFVVGENVEYYPDVARRIVAEGHVLGNHSYTHRAFTEFDVPDYSELDRAQSVIYQTTGVKPRLFRPPYGRKTPWELEYVKKKGLITVTWSDSANDPHKPPSDIIEKRILQHVHPGVIILLHDGNGTKHDSDRSQTVAALPKIIESLEAEGYTLVTIPELLQVSPYIE